MDQGENYSKVHGVYFCGWSGRELRTKVSRQTCLHPHLLGIKIVFFSPHRPLAKSLDRRVQKLSESLKEAIDTNMTRK